MHISLCAAKKTNVITALQDQHGPSLISLVASWRSASRVQEKQPSCVAHLRLTAAAAFCTFPLHINCRFQLHSASLSKWLLSSSFPPSLSLSFSVQLSGLGGIGQSSPSTSWKPGSLDLVGRQRSSSDPPNMHPPMPPMRLISTGGMNTN